MPSNRVYLTALDLAADLIEKGLQSDWFDIEELHRNGFIDEEIDAIGSEIGSIAQNLRNKAIMLESGDFYPLSDREV